MLAMVPMATVGQTVALTDATQLGIDRVLTDGSNTADHALEQWYKWEFNGAGTEVTVSEYNPPPQPRENVTLIFRMDPTQPSITYKSGPKLIVIGTDDLRMGQVFDLSSTGIKANGTLYVRFLEVSFGPPSMPLVQVMELRFSN